MSRRLAPFLAALFALAAAPATEPELTTNLPAGVPLPSVLVSWERIDGSFDDGPARVRYRLYVEPGRPFLYRITQFAVHRFDRHAEGDRLLSSGPEIVVWNETPGLRIPLRSYENEPVDAANPAAGVEWRPVLPGSDRYKWVMMQSIAIYRVQHGKERAAAAAAAPQP